MVCPSYRSNLEAIRNFCAVDAALMNLRRLVLVAMTSNARRFKSQPRPLKNVPNLALQVERLYLSLPLTVTNPGRFLLAWIEGILPPMLTVRTVCIPVEIQVAGCKADASPEGLSNASTREPFCLFMASDEVDAGFVTPISA